jgi:hypothetical protein
MGIIYYEQLVGRCGGLNNQIRREKKKRICFTTAPERYMYSKGGIRISE